MQSMINQARPYGAALLAVLLASSSGCESAEAKIALDAPKERTETSVEVTSMVASRAEVSVPVRATGTTEPMRAANLAPRVTARVQAVLVDEGDYVKKGAPLVRLDASTARMHAAEAAARAAQTEAQAKQVTSDLVRLSPLAERGTLPEQRIDQLRSQKEALDAASEAARVATQQAQQDVSDALVRAPFDGRVSSVSVETGEMAVTQPPTTLLRLLDLSKIDVRIPVHERDLSRIAVGDDADVRIESAKRDVTAKVTYIRPEIDPHTRTAEVVVRFDNDTAPLLAGMFAEVRIEPSQARGALVVPRTAIGRAGDERFVYVVQDGRAHRQTVEIEDLDEERTEITSGLDTGARIITNKLDWLSEGVAVRDAGGDAKGGTHAAPQDGEESSTALAERQAAP